MRRLKVKLLLLSLTLGILPLAIAEAPAAPASATVEASDLGELKALAGDTAMSITVALRLPDLLPSQVRFLIGTDGIATDLYADEGEIGVPRVIPQAANETQ